MQTKKIIMWVTTVIAVVAMVALANRPGSVTTVDLEGGHVAILNMEDSTWSYRQQPLEEDKNDIFMHMRDGRILWLKSDKTFTFTRTMPKVTPRIAIPRNLPSLEVVGVGQNQDLDRSTTASTADAYTKATTQLRKLLPTRVPPKTQEFLTACIRDQIKEHEIERSYTQSKQHGWRSEAKISVNQHRVRKIMDCLEFQLEPAPQ
jgi:hypothetical protein